MLCDKCKKNPAVAHIKTVINGMVYEKHLCEECAHEEQAGITFDNPFSSFFSSFFDGLPSTHEDTKVCPNCKTTLSDILNRGKIGCSECYKTFESDLIPYIKRIQGSSEHIGKGKSAPEGQTVAENDNETTIGKLKNELQLAVKEERYEDAAKLRDKISKLKEEE